MRTPEYLVEAIRESENQREEAWRENYLAEHLFHARHTDHVWNHNPESSVALLTLENEFLLEKKGKNMGERFAMALSDKYLGKIHKVELGSTTVPSASGAVDGLKSEYHDLLDWLKRNGIVDDELSRKQSGRSISIRTPAEPAALKEAIIMVRNRPLIKTELEHDGLQVDIDITKRMVFALPMTTARLTLNRFRHKLPPEALRSGQVITEAVPKLFNDEEVLHFIESTFLHHGSGGVIPIRTGYYLTTDIQQGAER